MVDRQDTAIRIVERDLKLRDGQAEPVGDKRLLGYLDDVRKIFGGDVINLGRLVRDERLDQIVKRLGPVEERGRKEQDRRGHGERSRNDQMRTRAGIRSMGFLPPAAAAKTRSRTISTTTPTTPTRHRPG